MQTTFSKFYVSHSVSLHDTTGRLRSGKCYLRSFPYFSFSTSAPNSIAMSTAPQQDFFSSTQPQPAVSNALTSVCSQPSATLTFSSETSVSTRDQFPVYSKRTAVMLLQVLIGYSEEKRCKKMKNAKGCFGSDVVARNIRSHMTQLDTRQW